MQDWIMFIFELKRKAACYWRGSISSSASCLPAQSLYTTTSLATYQFAISQVQMLSSLSALGIEQRPLNVFPKPAGIMLVKGFFRKKELSLLVQGTFLSGSWGIQHISSAQLLQCGWLLEYQVPPGNATSPHTAPIVHRSQQPRGSMECLQWGNFQKELLLPLYRVLASSFRLAPQLFLYHPARVGYSLARFGSQSW